MLKLRMKQTLALFLAGILVYPAQMTAAPGAALGSVTPRGAVNVGDVRVPGMSALFSGDQVQTGAGSALIQYQDGPRVVLGIQSQASFSASRVELKQGQMSFSTKAGGPLFAASTLRIEPVGSNSAADVTYVDHKASVAVTEGAFRVVDPSGVELASLRAGEARLFEEALPSAPAPAAAAPPAVPPAPQIGGGGSNRAWLLALGVGIVGTSLGIAGLVRASDADDRADEASAAANAAQADAAAAQAQAASAASQNAALQTSVNNLLAQVATLQSGLANQAEANEQLSALLSVQNELFAIQAESQDVQNEINELVLELASLQTAGSGPTTLALDAPRNLTIQQIIDRLLFLTGRLNALTVRYNAAVNRLNGIWATLNTIFSRITNP